MKLCTIILKPEKISYILFIFEAKKATISSWNNIQKSHKFWGYEEFLRILEANCHLTHKVCNAFYTWQKWGHNQPFIYMDWFCKPSWRGQSLLDGAESQSNPSRLLSKPTLMFKTLADLERLGARENWLSEVECRLKLFKSSRSMGNKESRCYLCIPRYITVQDGGVYCVTTAITLNLSTLTQNLV